MLPAKLDQLASEAPGTTVVPFGSYEEEAIISLALDYPEFFTAVGRFLTPDLFTRIETKYIIAELLTAYEKYSTVPTRGILRDLLRKSLTESHPWESVLAIVDRRSNPREVPLIKETLTKWARNRAYGLLYSQEAQDAYLGGNYDYLEEIIKTANRIADFGDKGFWFFEQFEALFLEEIMEHRTTGFPKLDRLLNNGGPSPGEVVCFLAATNVGKCSTYHTKIIEERLSRIYELELEDGSVIQLRGSREVQTARGRIKVADLADSDELTEIPIGSDSWDLELPIV